MISEKIFCTKEDCNNEVKSEGDYCNECLQDRADTIREQKEEDKMFNRRK